MALYSENELNKNSVCKEFLHTARDGKNYKTKHYNLDAIIAVGFKVNSKRALEFRLWAINILKQYSVKGYVLDKERLKNGTLLNENYFDELLQEIRKIRISERNFYQKITDIYSTSLDYKVASPLTKEFFKTVQNKMHYAVHNGKIIASDVTFAKNYLTKDKLSIKYLFLHKIMMKTLKNYTFWLEKTRKTKKTLDKSMKKCYNTSTFGE